MNSRLYCSSLPLFYIELEDCIINYALAKVLLVLPEYTLLNSTSSISIKNDVDLFGLAVV